MLRIAVALAVLAAIAFPLAGYASSSRSTAVPALKGVVGPGFHIDLETAAGKDVETLKAGTYKLVVQDKASIHNFRLKGPGLNVMVTSVPFVGTKTVTVTLKKGTYTYQCDPHAAAGMKGTVKVV